MSCNSKIENANTLYVLTVTKFQATIALEFVIYININKQQIQISDTFILRYYSS